MTDLQKLAAKCLKKEIIRQDLARWGKRIKKTSGKYAKTEHLRKLR